MRPKGFQPKFCIEPHKNLGYFALNHINFALNHIKYLVFCIEPHKILKKCGHDVKLPLDSVHFAVIELKQEAHRKTNGVSKMKNEESTSTSLQIDPAKVVVKELRYLAELHPNSNNAMSSGDLELQTFFRDDTRYTHRTVDDKLPLPTDAPVYYYVLGVLQKARMDDPSTRIVVVNVRDIVDGIGLTRAKSSYEGVRAAIRRYGRLNIGILRPGQAEETEFRLFGYSPVGKASYRLDFSQDYIDEIENDTTKTHYLALRHILPLGGLATSLYALMQSFLFHGQLKIRSRTFCRMWLGEERGNEIPVSRAFSAYVKPRLAEIKEKTGWEITATKVGRADKAMYVFDTAAVPNAFDVAKGEGSNKTAVDTPKPKAPKATQKRNGSLDPSVIEALPESVRQDRGVASHLSGLSVDDAIAVINYVRKRNRKGFPQFLNGIAKNKDICLFAKELRKEAKASGVADGFTADEISTFSRLWKFFCNDGDEAIRGYCEQDGLDYDRLMEWVAATQG